MNKMAPVETNTVPTQKNIHMSHVGGIHNLGSGILQYMWQLSNTTDLPS